MPHLLFYYVAFVYFQIDLGIKLRGFQSQSCTFHLKCFEHFHETQMGGSSWYDLKKRILKCDSDYKSRLIELHISSQK